ncbi:MAG: C-terminal binding protein [Planctomycetota bacterium]
MTARRGKVVVADFINDGLDIERSIIGELADISALDAYSEEDLVNRIEDADAVMLYHCIQITERTIDRLQNCKLIVRCGVGVDNVDRKAARARGIPVANVPDYGTEEVADSAIGMALTLTRGIHFLNSRLRRGVYPWTFQQASPIHRLRGRVFGIIGLGRIGAAAASRAKALGMRVLFYDPFLPDGYDKALGIERVETLESLLSQTHVLSLHCPLTDDTRHIVNAKTLAQLPQGSFLVNTARGGTVDPMAVVGALASGHLAGAALDVLVDEPPVEPSELLIAWRDPNHPAHDRLILNPHSAFYSEEGLNDMRIKGSQACRRALEGLPLRNIVN